MVKQGPCYHCGVTSTPLWRNGPPEKPVLCNACGSRWRTKGTLANYTPLHARSETDDYEDQRLCRAKNISLIKNKEVKLLKRKQNHDNLVSGWVASGYNQGSQKVIDEDASNRSSSGSAVSYSESCAQFAGTDASDLTGPAQSVVRDGMVPSKKRSCVNRQKPSSVEKLTKDLYTILHEQQSYFSASSEEDLIFDSETPMVSVEIGHGSVLIRHPSSIAREEESEASSLSVDNKQCPTSEAYSYSGAVDMRNDFTGMNFPSQGVENINYSASPGIQREKLKREPETSQILGYPDSPLCLIDLTDVVNSEVFFTNMTNEDQQKLLKCLPAVDTAKLPDSLKTMFNSFQFRKNLTYFQQLLGEGVFDTSSLGSNAGDCQALKRLALCDFSQSKWVEQYDLLKRCKYRDEKSVAFGCTGTASSNAANEKRLCDSTEQTFPELKSTVKSPQRVIMRAGSEGKEVFGDGSCFSPKGLLALPTDGSPQMLDSFNFVDESSDQDLLLEVRSNSSFPEAELLHPALRFGTQPSNSSSSAYQHVAYY
ncbi:GATA transcription factor 26 [Neltuma alba]|uniref:GATA transcription factor 26 n=1 Tax=Neltuma alba TaxID=207710 RepID=UPI0010A4B53E|nr:GATA transcription factor 26-like [Prosopis alba]XP_028776408.1 GATA transcription factor 26-like [Prosopis alba]